MADVDVVTEVVIPRPVTEVAAYAADPSNAPQWYANIASTDWKTEPPVRVGSRRGDRPPRLVRSRATPSPRTYESVRWFHEQAWQTSTT